MLLLALLACRPDKPDNDGVTDVTDDTSPADDTDTPGTDGFTVEVTPSDAIPTVMTVRFRAPLAGEGLVRFGCGDLEYEAAATQEDGGYTALIVGMAAASECWVEPSIGGVAGPRQVVETEPGPGWLPPLLEVEGNLSPGFYALGLIGGEAGPAIFDAQGRAVWWWPRPLDREANLVSRVQIAPEGGRVLFNLFPLLAVDSGAEDGAILEVALDGSSETIRELPSNHHDFYLHADGTLAWLDTDERAVGEETVRGDRLVERAPDGTERDVWNAWDTFTYDPNATSSPPGWWTLANNIEYVAAEDAYLVSLRNLDSVIRIDRVSRAVTLVLGGNEATVEPQEPFDGQHGLQATDEGVLVFDNRPTASTSRLLELRLDGASEASIAWSYTPQTPRPTPILGDALRLPSGRTLVVWSAAGVVEEVDSQAQVRGRLSFEPGTILGFVQHYERLVP